MKRIALILLSLMLCACTLAGCGKSKETIIEKPDGETIVVTTVPADQYELDKAVCGTWAENYFDSGFIFNEDGTGTDTFWDLTFTYTAANGTMILTYDTDAYGTSIYTYRFEGDKLALLRLDEEDTEEFLYEKK